MARPALTSLATIGGTRAGPVAVTPGRFDAWYVELRAPLRGYLRRVAGSAAVADDLFQETWVRLLTHPPRTADLPSVRTYVFTIASRLATDAWRRESWRQRWLRPRRRQPDGAGDEIDDRPSDTELAPDVQAAVREQVVRALACLSPRERALVWLAHVERYDHDEIAAILDLRPQSIRVLLHRARKRAAAALSDTKTRRGEP